MHERCEQGRQPFEERIAAEWLCCGLRCGIGDQIASAGVHYGAVSRAQEYSKLTVGNKPAQRSVVLRNRPSASLFIGSSNCPAMDGPILFRTPSFSVNCLCLGRAPSFSITSTDSTMALDLP